MTQKHSRTFTRVDPRSGYIGRPPISSYIGKPLASNYNHIANWYAGGMVYAYHGSRDLTGTLNPFDGTFWIITHQHYDAKVSPNTGRMMVGVLLWSLEPQNDITPADATMVYYGDQVTPQTIINDKGNGGVDYNGATKLDRNALRRCYYDLATPPAELVHSATSSGKPNLIKITYDYMSIAALSVWHIPHDSLADDSCRHLPKMYAEGSIIRHNTVGMLADDIGGNSADMANGEHSLERITRRNLFQTGHPSGITLAAGDHSNIFGSTTFPLYPRRFLPGDAECYPNVVVSAMGADDYIEYSADGHTCRYTHSGADIATETLVDAEHWDDTLTVDRDGAVECTISAHVEAGSTMVVHTVSLYEGAAWD